MKKFFLIFIIISFGFLTSNNYCFAQCYLEFSGIDTLIDKAVHLVQQEHYFDALRICEGIINEYPDNPMGYLGAAAIYHGIMRNYWINQYDNVFDSLLTISILKGKNAIKQFKNDAECYFIYGAALGFRGLHRIRKGQWFGAFLDGINGYRILKKAYNKDNKLYDAYYGLGLYYYWKSSKAKVLSFLKLIKDEREKGIEFIKIAIEKGRFVTIEGKFALVEIYYYEHRFDEAYKECMALQEKFSTDPTWLYLMAKILEEKEKWEESQSYFLALIDKLKKSSFFKSKGFLTACHYGLAKCAYNLGDYEKALTESNIALDLSKKRDKGKEIDGPLLDFEYILGQLKKLKIQLKKNNQKPL